MPGWHEGTEELQEQGRLQMVGIVEEQHPDRARLFMQWKQMGWPILTDPLNLLEVPYVPITLAIDEAGVIRKVRPSVDGLEDFLAAPPPPASDRTAGPAAEVADVLGSDLEDLSGGELARYASAVALWGGEDGPARAVAAYGALLDARPEDGYARFRRGVAYRMRYDSPRREPGDFQAAVTEWTAALEIDPNNYIWRRRIQQFGPRLDKPYSFYDWVETARVEIEARGETPVSVAVEPAGAELASPAKTLTPAGAKAEPDPGAEIHPDAEGFVRIETTVVPPKVAPGEPCRVHIVLRPEEAIEAHWNNEVGPTILWLDLPEGWDSAGRYLEIPPAAAAVSRETRAAEFEIVVPGDAPPGLVPIPGYALYYVCEGVEGACLYRRQDTALEVEITP